MESNESKLQEKSVAVEDIISTAEPVCADVKKPLISKWIVAGYVAFSGAFTAGACVCHALDLTPFMIGFAITIGLGMAYLICIDRPSNEKTLRYRTIFLIVLLFAIWGLISTCQSGYNRFFKAADGCYCFLSITGDCYCTTRYAGFVEQEAFLEWYGVNLSFHQDTKFDVRRDGQRWQHRMVLGNLVRKASSVKSVEELKSLIINEEPDLNSSVKSVEEVKSFIINEEPDLNTRDYFGKTLLHIVGDVETAKLLIAEGADVNAEDNVGQTPLHSAARKDSVGVAKLLIAAGADVNARDNKGLTPLDIAQEMENECMVKYLSGITDSI